ncbi:MAG TPA: BamA/TamA family outer membrane protein [Candidatus Limnocylindria bacterium]|nr:BamA/TamA family outer membrane protein [Candidatus Limnocylindria bacterium]
MSGSARLGAVRLAWLVAFAAKTAWAESTAPGAPPDSTPEGLPIRRIEIRARDIYEPVPRGRLVAFYRLANHLHVRTRQRTIRDELLFAPGDRWSEARARESERNLRALDILETRRIQARRVNDSVDVVVETRDSWTTNPEFNLESGGERVYGSVAFGERNLFGLGKSVGVGYGEDPTGISRNVSVTDPNVASTHVRASFAASTGSAGANNALFVGLPFWSEDAPWTFGVQWQKVTSVFSLFQEGEEVADFDQRLDLTKVFLGTGRRVRGTITRLTGSLTISDRRYGPSRVTPSAPPEFDGSEDNLHLRRLAVELRLWRPRPIERTGIDRLDGTEDFELGPSLAATAGVAPRLFGSAANEGYGEIQLSGGQELGSRTFGLAALELTSRLRPTPHEAVARFRGRFYTRVFPGHTIALGAWGVAGRNVGRDFQVVVGGLNGLRGYSVQELAGTQVWRLNAENRWLFGREYYQLFSLGAAAFYDAARAWGPGSAAGEWHHSAGLGLRISFPHSALNRVGRFDVAWPIDPSRDGRRDPVFSFGSSQAF